MYTLECLSKAEEDFYMLGDDWELVGDMNAFSL